METNFLPINRRGRRDPTLEPDRPDPPSQPDLDADRAHPLVQSVAADLGLGVDSHTATCLHGLDCATTPLRGPTKRRMNVSESHEAHKKRKISTLSPDSSASVVSTPLTTPHSNVLLKIASVQGEASASRNIALTRSKPWSTEGSITPPNASFHPLEQWTRQSQPDCSSSYQNASQPNNQVTPLIAPLTTIDAFHASSSRRQVDHRKPTYLQNNKLVSLKPSSPTLRNRQNASHISSTEGPVEIISKLIPVATSPCSSSEMELLADDEFVTDSPEDILQVASSCNSQHVYDHDDFGMVDEDLLDLDLATAGTVLPITVTAAPTGSPNHIPTPPPSAYSLQNSYDDFLARPEYEVHDDSGDMNFGLGSPAFDSDHLQSSPKRLTDLKLMKPVGAETEQWKRPAPFRTPFATCRSAVVSTCCQPIVRPRFPKAIHDRSPLLNVSSALVLRVCFRIGEAINIAALDARSSSSHTTEGSLVELYARVLESHRPATQNNARQEFVFGDVWSCKGPRLKGMWAGWKGSALFDREGTKLLTDDEVASSQAKMCRAVGRMKRQNEEWNYIIASIWECDWQDLMSVQGVVCGS